MGIQDIAKRRVDLYLMDPSDLREEEGWNVRNAGPELDAHVRQLADSIKEIGVLQPLTCYMKAGQPTITDGHCRLLAVKLAISEGADIKTVPVRVEERTANDADRVLSMLTRNSGKPLAPIEQAEVVKRLLAFGWEEKDIARKAGFSVTHVKNLLNLSAAPQEVKNMVSNGEVSAKTATEVIRKEGETQGTETLKKAVETAKEQGKQKATPKHLPKDPAKEAERTIAKVEEAKKAADKSTLAFPGKEAGKVTPLPKPGQEIDFAKHGPTMLKFMKAVRDVPDMNRLRELQAQAGPLIGGMMK